MDPPDFLWLIPLFPYHSPRRQLRRRRLPLLLVHLPQKQWIKASLPLLHTSTRLTTLSGLHQLDLLYFSYQAGEDNELSFAEGDRITEIEAASDDWWQGKDQHGNTGLFPGKRLAFLFLFPASLP